MAAEDISRCAIEISHKSKHPEGSMAEKKIPSNYFDMTLDECRLVFDTIDNLIIIDNQGIIKYFSPGMFSMVEAYNKRALPDVVSGKHKNQKFIQRRHTGGRHRLRYLHGWPRAQGFSG